MTVHDPRSRPPTQVVYTPPQEPQQMILPQKYIPQQYVAPPPSGVPLWAILVSAATLVGVLVLGTQGVSLTHETAAEPATVPTTRPTEKPVATAAPAWAAPTTIPAALVEPTAPIVPTDLPVVAEVVDAVPPPIVTTNEQVIIVRTTGNDQQHTSYTGSGACAVATGRAVRRGAGCH